MQLLGEVDREHLGALRLGDRAVLVEDEGLEVGEAGVGPSRQSAVAQPTRRAGSKPGQWTACSMVAAAVRRLTPSFS
jgi:hypothetical protein